jgi:hypothetical protein
MKKIFWIICAFALASASFASDEKEAYQAAKGVVPENQKTHVLSFFGKGTLQDISVWYVKFYDTSAKSDARVVVVENGKVVRFNAAEDQDNDDVRLTFDPSQYRVSSQAALKAASKYAQESVLPSDAVRIYLNRPAIGRAPVWTVELLYEGRSQGYIYANDKTGAFAGYRPPTSGKKSSERASSTSKSKSKSESGSSSSSEKSFGEEVEDTFLGIGGDLEEFFTGERTVDDD